MNTPDPIVGAVRVLGAGGVIAFPTETVYGLGADAHSCQAIDRVYALKGRDATKVMSVHVSDAVMARRYAGEWSELAARLVARFWPGPLTIVVRAKTGELCPRAITPDNTIGLRCPDHPATQQMIASFGRGIVGTSANVSGEPACTDADSVRRVFPDGSVYVIENDRATAGVASTVVSLVDPARPAILRHGALSADDLGI